VEASGESGGEAESAQAPGEVGEKGLLAAVEVLRARDVEKRARPNRSPVEGSTKGGVARRPEREAGERRGVGALVRRPDLEAVDGGAGVGEAPADRSPARSAARFRAAIRAPARRLRDDDEGARGIDGVSRPAARELPFAWALIKRAIGHRFSQTETTRLMIPLHDPVAGPPVAAAIEGKMPATPSKQPKRSRPAGADRTRQRSPPVDFLRPRRALGETKRAGAGGREKKAPARLEVDP
jgi:hypothetical protein